MNMLIQARLIDDIRSPFASWARWERAEHYLSPQFRPFVAESRATAAILANYTYSYRQRENITTKARFWKLYLNFISALGRLYNMPAANRNKRRESATDNQLGQLTFLNLRLTEEQFVDLDDKKVTATQLMTSLAAVVEGGIALSLNYNQEKETANATFMDKRPDSPANQYALSAFGSDVNDALKILLYKHLNVLGGDWTSLIGKSANTSRRG